MKRISAKARITKNYYPKVARVKIFSGRIK